LSNLGTAVSAIKALPERALILGTLTAPDVV